MESLTHDPYLNTVKRNLEDKRYKKLYEESKKRDIDSFLRKKVSITDFINLSEEMATVILFIGVLTIPYIIGVGFIFFIIAKGSIFTFKEMKMDQYSVLWAIGYEIIALFLLLMIFKSAISFKKSK